MEYDGMKWSGAELNGTEIPFHCCIFYIRRNETKQISSFRCIHSKLGEWKLKDWMEWNKME